MVATLWLGLSGALSLERPPRSFGDQIQTETLPKIRTHVAHAPLMIFEDRPALVGWLKKQPLQWSTVIASRAALRTLPLAIPDENEPENLLALFRAAALARLSAKHPNSTLSHTFANGATVAAKHVNSINPTSTAIAAACTLVAEITTARISRKKADRAYDSAVIAARGSLIETEIGPPDIFSKELARDVQSLREGTHFSQIVNSPLWHEGHQHVVFEWAQMVDYLRADGEHWSVWIDWYDRILTGSQTTEDEDEAFAFTTAPKDWSPSTMPRRESVNSAIATKLGEFVIDPAPIDSIVSPITIDRRPDGRIGVEPGGPFALPTVPELLTPADHRNALDSCRNRATQLAETASSPKFQGRSDYSQILTDYLKWLPNELGNGNLLFADGEARTLNKLFNVEEAILPTVFASKLSVLLEDHIALRSFYPEIERHYHAVRTGRVVTPLSRDAVQAIQTIIRSQTPKVFDETIVPAIVEAAKPVPDMRPPPQEDLPPADPNRPKPPKDPIAETDLQSSQSYVLASAYNRIWSILQKGKNAAQGVEGWQKTYNLLKPHIGSVIEFLRNFLPGDGGGPSLPPTIGA